MTSHADCAHPSTKADRAACRKARASNTAHVRNEADIRLDRVGKRQKVARRAAGAKAAWDDPNAVGAIDYDTLDDRIRDSKRKVRGSEVKVTKVDPATLRCD